MQESSDQTIAQRLTKQLDTISEKDFLWFLKETNLNLKDKDGNTMLHIAALRGFDDACTYLLSNGISSEANGKGIMPSSIALKSGFIPLAGKLRDNEERTSLKDGSADFRSGSHLLPTMNQEIFTPPASTNLLNVASYLDLPIEKARGVFNPVATTNDYEAPDWTLEDPDITGNSPVAEIGSEFHDSNSSTVGLKSTYLRVAFSGLLDELEEMLPVNDQRRPDLVVFRKKLNHECLDTIFREFVERFILFFPNEAKSKKNRLISLAERVLTSALKEFFSILWISARSVLQYVRKKIIPTCLDYVHRRKLAQLKVNAHPINGAKFLSEFIMLVFVLFLTTFLVIIILNLI